MIIFEVIGSLTSRLVSIISEQPIHQAAMHVHSDALLMLIAWGATGNERDNEGSVFRRSFFCLLFHDRNLFFFVHKKSWTPLHFASFRGNASTCQKLCALDGVDQNAVDNKSETALDLAVIYSQVDSARALRELNVDTSKVRVSAWTKVEITQLLDEH